MLERFRIFASLFFIGFLSMGFTNARGGKELLWWIWLIIIISIILFLIWIMFRPSEGKKEEVEKPLEGEPEEEKKTSVEELKERTKEVLRKEEVKEDDLKLIEGIGPKISQILKEHGIKTFKDLAQKEPEDLKQLLESKGIRGIVDPTTWPEQAKLAMESKWDELKKLQEELKGGRRTQS